MGSKVEVCMQRILQNYEELRGKGQQTFSDQSRIRFWDVVVLTACDGEQEEAFKIQIQQKLQNKTLPLCRYIVVSDRSPVAGCKIGAGGSTFLVIEKLKRLFLEDELRQLKVLLIHAGGWSQRLPSASVLGKLFMALPVGAFQDYDMLDVKLAMYTPFIPLMTSGIFITASDDIELFAFDAAELLASRTSIPPGFVALGHPSSISIGTTHGVFVCDPPTVSRGATFFPCSRVHQKSSVKEMRDSGAVYKDQNGEDKVISDSAYWIDMDVVVKLYRFYLANGLPTVEIDCYGDFMQPLGPDASVAYIERTQNAVLKDVRRLIFEALSGCSLNVLFLPDSHFIHLGTIPEYLDALCQNQTLRRCFAMSSTVIQSVLHEKCDISQQSVLEFCYFLSPVFVESNCLISGCSTEAISSWTTETTLTIPAGTFMHTIVMRKNDQRYYCTIFCGVSDDIKADVRKEDFKMFGSSIQDSLTAPSVSIWTLRIFPVCRFPGQSFLESLKIIHAVKAKQPVPLTPGQDVVSMSEVLHYKDVLGMIEYRERLRVRPEITPATAAHTILTAGITAVKPGPLIQHHVQLEDNLLRIMDFNGNVRFSCTVQQNVHLFAVGKAALGMIEALISTVGEHMKTAVVLTPSEFRETVEKHTHLTSDSKVRILYGGENNLADEESVTSTGLILDLIRNIHSPDVILFAISGGASALLVSPRPPVTLSEKLQVTRALMKRGAPIQDLNAVRGALSTVKSGGLTSYIQPGVSCASLILSDIIGDPVCLIGGGPTALAEQETQSAVSISKTYGLWDDVPSAVKEVLSITKRPELGVDLPNIVIGNNTMALRACQREALELGYQSVILTTRLDGNVREIAARFAGFIESVRTYRAGGDLPDVKTIRPCKPEVKVNIDWNLPFCLLTGGETTLQVAGTGKGGRNQEMVLAFAVALDQCSKSAAIGELVKGIFASCGSDGQDGPTDAAGAITAFPSDWDENGRHGAQAALNNNDSYNYFSSHENIISLIKIGMTGTNVMDLQVLLVE